MKSLLCILLTFLFLSLGQASSSQFVNHFLDSKRGDVVKGLDQIRQYLVKYGYLSIMKRDDSYEIFDHALEGAIKKFQTFYNLNVSGVLDERTLRLINTPRCGVPDNANGILPGHRKKQLSHNPFNTSYYAIGKTKWSKYNLSWATHNGTQIDAIAEIAKAIITWQYVSPFRFSNIGNYSDGDVRVAFFRGDHDDSYPFDGPGHVLAHSMYPPYGILHFDADENWVIGAHPGGVDIRSVALHEFGHILGLDHSRLKSAVMYAYMPFGATKTILTLDDIQGLKALYKYS